jgi:hypothetical protein
VTSPIQESDRLRAGDEFGTLLREAEPSPLSAERLERSRAAICTATIGAGVGAAAAAKTASAAGATAGVSVKLSIVAVVAIAVGGTAWHVSSRSGRVAPPAPAAHGLDRRPESVSVTRHELPAAVVIAAPAPAAASDTSSPTVRVPAPTAHPRDPEPAIASRVPATSASATLAPAPTSDHAATIAPPVEPPRAAAAVPSAPSDLDEQIAIYSAARDTAARGDYVRAAERLEQLLARFPSSPIAAEAQLGRADYLTRAGQLDAAAAALEHLIASDVMHGRRGELEQMLGDLRMKQGDCASALTAYQAALDAGVAERSRAAIRRARERCGGS